ncbi:endonuclease III [Capronia epimyces CBS 606.96]|uniref:Endonuclease III homolog n=1 Tax=Capronia epimyces CBS 606.96 TaxID=1182542 RepID=W9XA78_9EURO|nr:endonuclease III [Capronia epimyces CBS 606.96]EXJ77143.1 endonuclease III [Capronia epimyces CBS 606.96]
MRTSRISQETTRIFNALSPNARPGRTTRSAKRIASFALGHNGEVEVHEKEETDDNDDDDDSDHVAHSSASQTPDIEDALGPPARSRSSRKRKFGAGPVTTKIKKEKSHDKDGTTSAGTTVTTKSEEQETATATVRWDSSRRVKNEEDENDDDDDDDDDYDDNEEEEDVALPDHSRSRARAKVPSKARTRARAKPKVPARKTTSPSGTIRIQPPSNWSEMYDTIKAMRQRNPTAPVDTMGCEDLFWPAAPPREKRYHTLTALMLSSQTKDTVTAAAMYRLHTELAPTADEEGNVAQSKANGESQVQQSTLTVDNIIACDPKHLDSLIGKVGFHNNKTKYIKQVATILKAQYNSDIPGTVEGLVSLPGVGPKMAYLCMSAAWGRDEGIGVDVHVHRITNLWGWHKTKTPEETRACLQSWLPRDKWHEINKMLVGLGQTVCLPVGRRCGECDLAGTGLCKAEIRGWKATQKKVKREKVEVQIDQGAVENFKEEGEVQTGQAVVKTEQEEVVTTKIKEEVVEP